VLLVEDNPNDVELIVAELERSGYDLRFERVDSVERLQNALVEGGWEIVLSDYNVPAYDVFAALAVVIEHGQDVPFLVVSGTIREEAVAAVIRAGARDCVVKSNLTRLGFVVARELEEVSSRRAHRETEEALRRSEERFRLLAENAADVVYRYRLLPELELEYISPAVTAVGGYTPEEHYADPELRAKVVHPDDQQLWERAVTDPSPELVVVRWIGKDGEVIWVEQRNVGVRDDEGRLVAIEGIARDITPRIRLEEQLRQAQKMEAVGQLAGGIAHDFNNLLTVIIGYTDILLGRLGREARGSGELAEIGRAAERAAELTGQLLAYSRKQILEPRVLDLNDLVTEIQAMLERLIGEHIEFSTRLAEDLGSISADEGQIGQIIMNLVLNARDAMSEGGTLLLETGNLTLADSTNRRPDMAAGDYVMLAVSDSGKGMDAATVERIFEPFYTTKERGVGTGLGLATVYGIVTQSGGHVEVESEPGIGSTFRLYFPQVAEEAEAVVPKPSDKRPLIGSETVLFVEDEEALRRVGRQMLETYGYTVLLAEDGAAGLELAQNHPDPIQLLMTDIMMPKMGGTELAERLSALRPELKVLYTSGYNDSGGSLQRVAGARYLQKPYAMEDLARTLRELLDSAA
jgi:PAS domain S-box-containing protein